MSDLFFRISFLFLVLQWCGNSFFVIVKLNYCKGKEMQTEMCNLLNYQKEISYRNAAQK